MTDSPRLLILGAHPDDAEFHAGGLAAAYASAGRAVRMISVTNGGAGHHRLASDELVSIRRAEAAASGRRIGAEYLTWDFPDGRLQPTLEVREAIIHEIRTFQPDLVLTHRPCDYHPDHRAVGQAVQDASYLVTVPLVMPDVDALPCDPVVAYMVDHFTKPYPFDAHIVTDIEPHLDTVVDMLSEHRSQVFDFLPHNHRLQTPVPEEEDDRKKWLKEWYIEGMAWRRDRFANQIVEAYGEPRAKSIRWIEAFEISEYAGKMNGVDARRLFGA